MAVTFKNLPAAHDADVEKTFPYLQDQVAILLDIPTNCQIKVGMTETQIERSGVRITLPFGIPHIKKGDPKNPNPTLILARDILQDMLPHTTLTASQTGLINQPQYDPNASVPIPAQPIAYDDMNDEQWMEHTAGKLFPGTIHLYQADEMYQPVLGTSGGSIYKTCFIGPELKVACRIKKSSISLRVTTQLDKAPEGDIRKVFSRLGTFQEYNNRLTTHAQCSGPYDVEHAHEYRALFGAYYAALKPWITSGFPAIGKLAEGVK